MEVTFVVVQFTHVSGHGAEMELRVKNKNFSLDQTVLLMCSQNK